MTSWCEIRKPDTLDALRYMVRLALEDHNGHVVSTVVRSELVRAKDQRCREKLRERYLRSVA